MKQVNGYFNWSFTGIWILLKPMHISLHARNLYFSIPLKWHIKHNLFDFVFVSLQMWVLSVSSA